MLLDHLPRRDTPLPSMDAREPSPESQEPNWQSEEGKNVQLMQDKADEKPISEENVKSEQATYKSSEKNNEQSTEKIEEQEEEDEVEEEEDKGDSECGWDNSSPEVTPQRQDE